MKPGSYFGDVRWLPVKNQHAEDVPSFGAMEITGAQIENGQVIYLVTRPTADSLTNVLINGETKIAGSGGYGNGTTEPLIALCDSGATPAEGERWGTKRDSWKLHQHFIGFTIQGGNQGSGTSLRAFTREQMTVQIVFIELLTSLNPGGSATAKILWIIAGAPAASTMDNITVFDPAGIFTNDAGDRGYAYYDHQAQRWHVLNLQC